MNFNDQLDAEFKRDCRDMMVRMQAEPMRPRGRQVIHVSRKLGKQLEAFCTPDISPSDRAIIDRNFVLPIHVTDSLPIVEQTGRIIQLDRFATYEADDMAWAVPAGLAKWETVETHAMVVVLPEQPFLLAGCTP